MIRLSPRSERVVRGRVAEVRARTITGMSAGLTLTKVGGLGISGGKTPRAAAMAALMSWAAASIFRDRANWTLMVVVPRDEVEVMESMPLMEANCFSRGRATAAAMISGLAPGSLAVTLMVGKSTVGRLLIGSRS